MPDLPYLRVVSFVPRHTSFLVIFIQILHFYLKKISVYRAVTVGVHSLSGLASRIFHTPVVQVLGQMAGTPGLVVWVCR